MKELSFYDLLVAYLIAFLLFFFTIPTIYIRNEIYFISRDISELRTTKELLLEENSALRQKMEYMHYKSEILDPIEVHIDNE
ncbi:MAG: hypothetical protein MR902_03280 [Campylobacter sp.]|nr:hypothetical protein [Campylobacter sp.]